MEVTGGSESTRMGLSMPEQRKQQKMTQQQLADKIGKKREYISNIERGNSDIKSATSFFRNTDGIECYGQGYGNEW